MIVVSGMSWRVGKVGFLFRSTLRKRLAWPLLLTSPPQRQATLSDDPAAASLRLLSCFCCIFCKKRVMGGVKLMRWVWVISRSNHWHLQWQDLSAYVIVHCSNSLSLKFSACIMFLKIYHGNIKDLMQRFVQPLEFEVNWTSSVLYPGCWL